LRGSDCHRPWLAEPWVAPTFPTKAAEEEEEPEEPEEEAS